MGNKQRPRPALHVRLLGDFRVAFGDEPIATFNTPRLQALLAYLLLHRDAPQSRQQIAFLFWPDSSEEQAQANLRNLLFAFRHALPGIEQYISIDKRTLQWKAHGSASSDMAEFESALAGAQGATDQVHALRKAIDLYEGDILPGCYDEWIVIPRERLRQRFLDALQQLIDLLQGSRDLGTAILYAQLLLRHDPLKEQNYRQLMRLHLDNGDSAGALSVYRQCERCCVRTSRCSLLLPLASWHARHKQANLCWVGGFPARSLRNPVLRTRVARAEQQAICPPRPPRS